MTRNRLAITLLITILVAAITATISIVASSKQAGSSPSKPVLIYNGTDFSIYRYGDYMLVVEKNSFKYRGSVALPGAGAAKKAIERRLSPEGFTLANNTAIVYWFGQESYFVGDNYTFNVLAIGPNGPVEGLEVNVTITMYGNGGTTVLNRVLTTDENGLARIEGKIPPNATWLRAEVEPMTENSIEKHDLGAWADVTGPYMIYSVFLQSLRPGDNIVLLGLDKYAHPLNASIDLKAYVRSFNITALANGEIEITQTILDLGNVSLVDGKAIIPLNNVPPFSDVALSATYWVNNTQYSQHVTDVVVYNDTYVEVVPLIAWGSFSADKISIPLIAVYGNDTAFNGDVLLKLTLEYENGSWINKPIWVHFNNGRAMVNISTVNITYISLNDYGFYVFSIARVGNKFYTVMTKGVYLSKYKQQQPGQAPLPSTKPQLHLTAYYDSWMNAIIAFVTYNETPVAGVPVYFYLPWSSAGVVVNTTDHSGTAYLYVKYLRSYINSSTLTGRERLMKLDDARIVIAVSYMNQSAIHVEYLSTCLCSYLENVQQLSPYLYNATVCIPDSPDSYTLDGIPIPVFIKLTSSPGEGGAGIVANATLLTPGSCKVLKAESSTKAYTILDFTISLSRDCECLSGYSFYPYTVSVEDEGCWAWRDALGGTGLDLNVSVAYNESPVEGALVIGALLYEKDGEALADNTTDSGGHALLVFDVPNLGTYLWGRIAAFVNNTLALCNGGLIHVWGYITPIPASTTTSTTTSSTTSSTTATGTSTSSSMSSKSSAPIVGGTLITIAGGRPGASTYLVATVAVVAVALVYLALRRRGDT